MRPAQRFRSRPLAFQTLALLALLAFGTVGCQVLSGGSGPASAPGESRLQRILESGELRVGLSADIPPLNMVDKNGKIVGFEVDMVEALANGMGLEVRLVKRPFPDLLPTLERGEVDLVISGLTITPERNARVAFAGPYFISGTSVLAKSEEISHARSPVELDVAGRTYAALASSTSAQFVADMLPEAKLVTTSDYETAVQMVIEGKADALFADHLICRLSVWRNPDAGLSAMSPPLTVEPLGIALPADDPLLLNLVQNYLKTLRSTGLLGRYKAKWLADGSWMKELP